MTGARLLRRGTISAARVQAASTVNVLSLPGVAGNYVSTPDSTANSITGDIDIRAKLALPDWTPAAAGYLVSKWVSTTQRSYQIAILTDGTLAFTVSSTGSNQISSISAATGFVAGSAHWLRATLDVNNGLNQRVFVFYTSDDGVAWTQLSSATQATAITIFNSTSPVQIGASDVGGTGAPLLGTVHYAEVRDGIDGTVVQSFDPSAVTPAGTRNPSTVAAGGPWTINGILWDWAEVAA